MSERGILVLGVGNPLMGDDGFGLAVLEELRLGWELPVRVALVDGGTWGMNLLPLVEDASALLVLDAIEINAEPGTPVALDRAALPRYVGLKLSPHQVDLREVFAICALRGTLPGQAAAIGVQPSSIELRLGLSPAVAATVPRTAERAVRTLERWGVRCARRGAALDA